MGVAAGSPLLERERELERLSGALDELAAGGPSAVVIEGEPGIGKTRLLAELADLTRARGGGVLSGRAAEYEATLPFAAFVDALDDHAPAARDLTASDLAELARVLPSLGEAASAGGVVDERHRLHAAVRRLLSALAGSGVLVLVLDDLHWADPASVDLIGALLRRPPPGEVLLALAFRPRQVAERLRADVAAAERDGRAEILQPQPLGSEATAVLAGDADARAIYEESGGNPFYIEQLTRGRGAPASTADGRAGDVPPAVAAALEEELRAVGPEARLVLSGAAVAGAEFEPLLVAETAELTSEAVQQGLDELLAAGLVRPAAAPASFTLRHPLVRRAVYQGSGAAWRLGAHGRAAAALRARGVPPEGLAHHVAQSAIQGDEEAIELLTQAAAATRARAPATAADWLARAIELLPPGAGDRRWRLTTELADARVASGRLELGRAALLDAIAQTGDVAERVLLIAHCAGLENLVGRLEEAHARLRAALEDLPDAGDLERLELMVGLAATAFHRLEIAEMVEWGRRALEEGERCGMPAHAAAGAGLLGLGEAFVGRTPAAREACNRGARLIDAASDDELARCLSAPEWMGLACMYVERFDEAVAFSGRGIAIARSTGQGHRIPVLAVSYGFAATMLGRVAEAVATTDSAVEGARLMDSPFSLAWLLLNASFASWHAGDLVRARRQLLETIERLEALDDSVLEPNARSQLGQVELDAGDHRFAVRTLLESCGGPELPRIGGFWQIFVFESLARAEAAGGRPAEARAAAERAMAAAPALELELTLGVAKRAMAFVLLGEDDAESAAELAQECAAAAQAVGARIEEGRARALAGRAHAAAGRRADALAQLRAAAETFEECRARREEEAARAVLQRLGEVRRPTSRGDEPGGLGALTGRETEIAELVWDRRTNREIAEALFLSTKTVESHLRNIFAKAGVSSRVELAREVERSRVAALT